MQIQLTAKECANLQDQQKKQQQRRQALTKKRKNKIKSVEFSGKLDVLKIFRKSFLI